MEDVQPKEDCAPTQPGPTPPSHSKRPSQPLYVPKQRLNVSKEKDQTRGEVKPRTRPRYPDKARKNAKNKKDKAGGAEKAAPAGEDGVETQSNDAKPDVKEDRLQGVEVEVNGQSSANVVGGDAAQQEEKAPQEEKGEEESWDTLFNDDGDCLDPHLLEEVRA